MIKEYYEILEKNKEFFDRAFDIAKQIAKKAEEMRLSKFLETSAKTGANVHSAFVSIIEEALKIT